MRLFWVLLAVVFVLRTLPWIALGGVLLLAVHLVVTSLDEGRARKAALAARADQQHRWVMAGDPRGIYGLYTPLL